MPPPAPQSHVARGALRRPGRAERSAWRSFGIAILSLVGALFLALYSGAAAEDGRLWTAGAAALGALLVAGWVALMIVPVLARRTPLRWLVYHIDYKLTREGLIYIAAVFVVALAALNTGNNLLFLILASLLAGMLVSGVFSRTVLSGIELRFELPEHVFAQQPVLALVELHNGKQTLPSFSLKVAGGTEKSPSELVRQPLFFPYVPRRESARQHVEITFPRRGTFRQDIFRMSTRFPFGFLQKTRTMHVDREVVVYPEVTPTEEFYEILPLMTGELESFARGRGHDLYSIRDYQLSDSARFVDWKASAKTSELKVREFTREDERRVILALDPFLAVPGGRAGDIEDITPGERFERAVTLCACLAWHFYEIDSALEFRCGSARTPMAPAGENIYEVLRSLALVEARESGEGRTFLEGLADDMQVFKIVLTGQPRGSIPTSLWSTSYMLFFDSL